jgi:serine/threonine-protein kinase HipA
VSTVGAVMLWGSRIGAVMLDDDADVAKFEYDADFQRSGIELSPMVMPLSNEVYQFPGLARDTFHGLPGLLADSLPDRFGNALIDAWLATIGRGSDYLNAVERLCYTGLRGMGALEFQPAQGPDPSGPTQLQVTKLVGLASDILTHRDSLRTSFEDPKKADAIRDILRVGTSAGGARAKAVIAWNPDTNEVRSGQVASGDGFEHWLIKLDGVVGNKDKELEDPQGYGAIEFAYSKMAGDAGLTMSECRLFEEEGRRHFMTRRFDRLADGDKLHMQSLGALGHYDFNMPMAHGYEQALAAVRSLGLGIDDIEEMYRRMVFNIVARNQDDHVKNISFLMDRRAEWSLAPAFDVTYSYNPSGRYTGRHQMTLNGKADGFTMGDFKACAQTASMKKGLAESIIDEVQKTVSRWTDYADDAGVKSSHRDKIRRALRTTPFPE